MYSELPFHQMPRFFLTRHCQSRHCCRLMALLVRRHHPEPLQFPK
jgi:hypothetical protein